MGQIQMSLLETWMFQKNDEYMIPAYAVYPIMERLEPGGRWYGVLLTGRTEPRA